MTELSRVNYKGFRNNTISESGRRIHCEFKGDHLIRMYDYGEMIPTSSLTDYPFYNEQCNILFTPNFPFYPIITTIRSSQINWKNEDYFL